MHWRNCGWREWTTSLRPPPHKKKYPLLISIKAPHGLFQINSFVRWAVAPSQNFNPSGAYAEMSSMVSRYLHRNHKIQNIFCFYQSFILWVVKKKLF